MTLRELKDAILKAEMKGLGQDADVCFDTEARTFHCHLVGIDHASPLMGDESPDEKTYLILSTRYH
jgi:hypothetical protein